MNINIETNITQTLTTEQVDILARDLCGVITTPSDTGIPKCNFITTGINATCLKVHQESVDALRLKGINVTYTAAYIFIMDPEVESVLKTALNKDEDEGITAQEASDMNLGTLFKNNTNIVSFDEFSYFTSQHARDTSFEGCTNLERIDISNCSKLPVFFGDTNLEYYNGPSSVQGTCIIPDGVTEIRTNGFQNNYKLTAVHIPSSITTMNNGSFVGDNNLQEVHITDLDAWCRINFTFTNSNPLLVGAHKLYINGTQATSIDIPSTITTLKQYVFRNFETMQQVTIPSSITAINSNAFEGCTGLQRVNITDLDAWMDIAFGNDNANPLTNAHNLYLNNVLVTTVDCTGMSTLKSYVFAGCLSLTSITNISSITTIGQGVFKGCTNLTGNLDLSNVTSIGERAFSNCKLLTSYTLGNITELPTEVFSGCTALTSIVIPNTVTKIGGSAFGGIFKTLHQNLVIPSSVTSIGWGAFNSTTFDSATIMATVPPTLLGNNAFNSNSQYPIYVPAGSVDAYKSASVWSSLASRIQAIPT